MWAVGELQQPKLHGLTLSILQIVDKYKSPNSVYQSEGHPL